MVAALITGASRGLGRLIATSLASRSVDTIIVGRNESRLLATASAIKSVNPTVRVSAVQLDLSNADAIDRIVDIARDFGGVDILVNNAAMQGPIGKSWEVTAKSFDETFYLNFLVPAAICRAFIPDMIAKQAGWIVNLSGGGATSPRPMFAAYGAAKTALVRFSETLAIECQGLGIRVNAVAPGAFRSGMTDAVLEAGARSGTAEIETAARLVQQDSDAAGLAAELITYLVCGDGRDISGKLISAVWDDWKSLHKRSLVFDDLYTLRRIVPDHAKR